MDVQKAAAAAAEVTHSNCLQYQICFHFFFLVSVFWEQAKMKMNGKNAAEDKLQREKGIQ